MYARHRSPGNGYRSNSMGMGMAGGSRISPDAREHGFYSSTDYRSFNRSFGRSHGQPKAFQQSAPPPPPPPPLSRKGDVFMEAGRLAAEYLVSKGMLPPSVLSWKWQNNGNFKKEFQEFRSQEGDNMQFSSEGRTSTLSRLRSSGADAGPGRRRHLDEFGPVGLRNYPKGKRRGGSFRGYNSDWGREYGRNGSWSEKLRGNSNMDVDNDAESSHHEEQLDSREDNCHLSGKDDNASLEKPSSEAEVNSDNAGGPGSENKEPAAEKEAMHDTDVGSISKPSNSNSSKGKAEEVEDGYASDDVVKHIGVETMLSKSPEEAAPDLQTLCRFPQMPTKTRSLLTSRRSKVVGVDTFDAGTSRGSDGLVEEETVNGSSGHSCVDNPCESKCLESETADVVACQNAKAGNDLLPELSIDQGEHLESRSSQEPENLIPDKDLELNEFGNLSSGTEKRGEKRAIEESDILEGNKKTREWLSNSFRKEPAALNEESPTNDAQLLIKEEDGLEFSQEKQLFPNSFKICDLNLVETSDAAENLDRDLVTIYPSMTKKEVSPVDIDLTISNSNLPSQLPRHVPDGRMIEIIDLETDDSAPEDKPFDGEMKAETGFTSLDGFSNHLPSTSVIPDNQDGYGLMFSDYMTNEFTGCSSVPGEMNPLDNMGLHNGEGPLGDDSLYMFGEMPFLGFIPSWEQPAPQHDRKPF